VSRGQEILLKFINEIKILRVKLSSTMEKLSPYHSRSSGPQSHLSQYMCHVYRKCGFRFSICEKIKGRENGKEKF
jgi:hypothetical protein